MYYMLKDIVKTLEAALPLGLLAGALIFVLKRYVFKTSQNCMPCAKSPFGHMYLYCFIAP